MSGPRREVEVRSIAGVMRHRQGVYRFGDKPMPFQMQGAKLRQFGWGALTLVLCGFLGFGPTAGVWAALFTPFSLIGLTGAQFYVPPIVVFMTCVIESPDGRPLMVWAWYAVSARRDVAETAGRRLADDAKPVHKVAVYPARGLGELRVGGPVTLRFYGMDPSPHCEHVDGAWRVTHDMRRPGKGEPMLTIPVREGEVVRFAR